MEGKETGQRGGLVVNLGFRESLRAERRTWDLDSENSSDRRRLPSQQAEDAGVISLLTLPRS